MSNPQAGYDLATGAAHTVTYAYDEVGNRTSVTDSAARGAGATRAYTSNNLNQYTAVGSVSPTYTPRGDLLSDGTWTYGYDYEGHLISATKPGTNVTYKYDTNGRRIEKDLNGVAAARYVYDEDNLIEERDGAGATVTAAYVYAGGVDHPVAVVKASGTYYFAQDALGSVTALTDASGTLVEQYSYDVYGQPTIKDGTGTLKTTTLTPFLFTGREYDAETGLYHYRSRAYSPAMGRFLQPDSIDFSGGDVNIYRYVANNPVDSVDPMGLWVQFMGGGTRDFWSAWTDNFNRHWTDSAFRDWWNNVNAGRDCYRIGPRLNSTLPQNSPSADDQSSAAQRAAQLGNAGHYNVTGYGYSGDPNTDSQTRMGLGNHNNILNQDSVALSPDVARALGLHVGNPVVINGHFLGYYGDSTRADLRNRVDIYDPNNIMHH